MLGTPGNWFLIHIPLFYSSTYSIYQYKYHLFLSSTIYARQEHKSEVLSMEFICRRRPLNGWKGVRKVIWLEKIKIRWEYKMEVEKRMVKEKWSVVKERGGRLEKIKFILFITIKLFIISVYFLSIQVFCEFIAKSNLSPLTLRSALCTAASKIPHTSPHLLSLCKGCSTNGSSNGPDLISLDSSSANTSPSEWKNQRLHGFIADTRLLFPRWLLNIPKFMCLMLPNCFFRWLWQLPPCRNCIFVPFWMELRSGIRVPTGIYKYLDYFQNLIPHLHTKIYTSRNSRNKDVFKLISSDNRMIIKKAADCHIAWQNIISNIIECLLSCLIFVHVKRITYFSDEDPLPTCFYCVNRRAQVFYLCFP